MAFDVEAARAEGYSDEDIEKYLASLGQTMSGQPIPATPAVQPQVPMDRSNEYMGLAGAGALGAGAALAGKALVLDPIRQGISNMMSAGSAPTSASLASPAVRQGAGVMSGMARGVGGALASGPVAPATALMMPYQMAAYEQDKIRANPNAPGLEYNPYAQVQRGEYATQRSAGAANQRSAVRNQQYGGLTPEEQAILEKDRLNMQMRMQAAKRVLGQQ